MNRPDANPCTGAGAHKTNTDERTKDKKLTGYRDKKLTGYSKQDTTLQGENAKTRKDQTIWTKYLS